jgi:DNA-binding response OmpR family regulator
MGKMVRDYVGGILMKRILIADDEKALRMLIVGTLEIGDFEVYEVDNGIDALKMVEKEIPDLVILDVMMPGVTGYEVCRQIKSNGALKNTKVLILTAKGQGADEIMARDVHADYYVPKPFSPHELLSKVEEILGV